MLTDPERTLLFQAQALLAQALSQPSAPHISTEAEFDAAYASALSGSVLALSRDFVYGKHFVFDKSVTIVGPSTTSGRMTSDEVLPRFTNGIDYVGNASILLEVQVTAVDPLHDVVTMTGGGGKVWRCRILGDAVNGGKRGIAANGSDMTISECYFDNFFLVGTDTQAICSWDMGGGLTIDDCYLGAAAESVMFGGADASSEARMPHNIVLSNSTLTKNNAWWNSNAQIKCALEFKCASNVEVFNCVLEWAGWSQGQGAYLIDATVRNQDGTAPWSTIKNIHIHDCTGRLASGIVNILGSDDQNPSVTLDGLTIENCSFTNIDWGNPGRLFTFDRAPHNVKLSNITVQGNNLNALGYFSGPPPVGMVLSGMNLPPATYGWKIDGGGMGRAALQAYAPDAQLDATIV